MIDRMTDALRDEGYRLTEQRRTALRVIAGSHDHFTPKAIYDRVRKDYPTIGLVTIYRMLEILAQLNFLCRVHSEEGCRSYLLRRPGGHHHHIVCSSCGRVEDFTECGLGELRRRLSEETGFDIRDHVLEFNGVCAECLKTRAAGKGASEHEGGGEKMNGRSLRKRHVGRRWAVLPGLGVILMLLSLLGACASRPISTSEKLSVVTTSNIIADWVSTVGGERVGVFALLPAGSDPHTFQPGPQDVARVSQADLVFTVGLGLEGIWLERLLNNAATDPARVVSLGEYVDALAAEGTGDDHGEIDPHFWWDPVRVKKAVAEIQQRLAGADPGGAESYARNEASYQQELDRLHVRIGERVGQIPPGQRKLVTSHETMHYFASRYGFEAIGSVFPGITTEREPTPSELTALVSEIRKFGVPAIFTETIVSDRLARAIATETGVKLVRLYSDSLGVPGSGADSYLRMMETNVEAIYQALK